MAITAGRAGSAQTVADATPTQILNGTPVRSLWVRCDAASAASGGFRVSNQNQSIHDASGNALTLAPGEEFVFEADPSNPISGCLVSGSGGTATLSWSVIHAG